MSSYHFLVICSEQLFDMLTGAHFPERFSLPPTQIFGNPEQPEDSQRLNVTFSYVKQLLWNQYLINQAEVWLRARTFVA